MQPLKRSVIATVAALLAMAATSASALTITPVTNAGTAVDTLQGALLAPGSGITVLPGGTFQGSVTAPQSATYTGFNVVPAGPGPTLTLPNGIFLTSGTSEIPLTNTVNQFNPVFPGSGANALLTTLSGKSTFDANALNFSFTVEAGKTSVSAQFVFGTDEFPTQSVTDIFGFFVDGVNYAKFPSGELISNTPGNPTNFITNPVGGGLYGLEYNGVTQVFTVVGLLDDTLATHTITIAVADTNDTIFDSGVFVGALAAGTATGGGIVLPPPIPEPETYAMMLAGLGLVGFAARRRKRKQ